MAAEFAAGDGHLVDLVGAVRNSQRAHVCVHFGQREELGHAAGTVHLDRPVDHLERHVGNGHLDAGDLLRCGLVADRVHEVRHVQHVLAGLVDLDAGLGDPVLDQALLGDRLAERLAFERPLAHELQCPLGDADRSHAVVDAARAEACLADGEALALAAQDVILGHPDVLIDQLGVTAPVVVAEDQRITIDADAFSVAGHDDHRLLAMARTVRVVLAHDDQHLALGPQGIRGEPLAPVQHVLVTVAVDPQSDIGRVGAGDLGLGHRERRADFAFEQRRQVLLLDPLGAIEVQDLHVAGVGSGAVQRLRAERDLAELL